MKGERQPQSYLEAAQEIHSHRYSPHTREKRETSLAAENTKKTHVKKGLGDSVSTICVCVSDTYVDI